MSLPPTVTSGSEPPVMQASSSTVASTAAMLPSSTPGSAILAGPANVDCFAIRTIRLLHPSSTPGGVTPPPPPSFPPATSPFVLTTTTVPLLTASGSASLPPLPSASFPSRFPAPQPFSAFPSTVPARNPVFPVGVNPSNVLLDQARGTPSWISLLQPLDSFPGVSAPSNPVLGEFPASVLRPGWISLSLWLGPRSLLCRQN